jgi:hypothetical protein
MNDDVTIARCVELAIRTEEMGAELYQRLAGKFAADRELRELGGAGARRGPPPGAVQRAPPERPVAMDRPLTDAQRNYLRAMSMDDVLASTRHLESLDEIRTRDDALERTLGLEKGTLAFYQAMRDVLGSDEVLDALVAAEKSHVVKVMELMVTGAKFRGLGDRF